MDTLKTIIKQKNCRGIQCVNCDLWDIEIYRCKLQCTDTYINLLNLLEKEKNISMLFDKCLYESALVYNKLLKIKEILS